MLEAPQSLEEHPAQPSTRAPRATAMREENDASPHVPLTASLWNTFTSLVAQLLMPIWHLGWHLLVLATWIFPFFWDGKHYFYLARRCWAPGLLRIGRASATFVGVERVDWTKPCVIVANHQGNTDIPLLFMLVPGRIRFLAKRSVGHIPVLGWTLRLAGFPFIDRKSPRKGRESIEAVARRIRAENLIVAIFPEGTRTPEGTMLPFKKGAFILALRARVPVIPVAIEGSGDALARGSFRIIPTKLKVTVCEPIETTGLTEADRDRLAAKAEQAIARELGWRRISPADLPAERAKDRARRYALLARR